MNDPVAFAALQRLLTDLGFITTTVAGSHFTCQHAASGCLLVYPFYQQDDTVSPAHLAATRRFLDEYGLVARDQFEDLLRQRSLVG